MLNPMRGNKLKVRTGVQKGRHLVLVLNTEPTFERVVLILLLLSVYRSADGEFPISVSTCCNCCFGCLIEDEVVVVASFRKEVV